MSGVKLTEAERETLRLTIQWHMNCHRENDGSSYISLCVANAERDVERILADRIAAAWDEGYDMGDPYQRRGNPNEGKHRNPYRAALTTEADQ